MQANKKTTIMRVALPLTILAIALFGASLILNNPPQSKRKGPSKAPQMVVEALELAPQSYQIKLDSFGTVKPRTQSALVSQVSGQINYIADNFRDGGFFEKGDVLLTLDDRDYKADVKVAEATLLSARQNLAEEQAKTEQARIDWQRLGNSDEQPNDLVLRKPQLEAAKASVLSAEAQLEKALLSLERTQIVAPYAGRILERTVDLGQVVSGNAQLASIYATDYVEVRLPINNNDLRFIELPEEFRHQNSSQADTLPKVKFASELMKNEHWQGQVVRTESAIDDDTQQLYVVAQVDNPYAHNAHKMQLKINQYVTATIDGKTLENVIIIPNKAIYQGSYVYTVEQGLLMRKAIAIAWKNDQDALISEGLKPGEKLVTTALGQVSSGTPVSLAGESPADRRSPNKGAPGMRKPPKGEKPAEDRS